MNENTLVSKAIQGNQDALTALFTRYRRVLYSLAHRVLQNHEEALDAVQGCLRSALSNLPTFNCEGSFRAWLVRLLINEAVSTLRKRRGALTIASENS
jgi:RNA polymerase sigma-70 factor (ECF subfamily)